MTKSRNTILDILMNYLSKTVVAIVVGIVALSLVAAALYRVNKDNHVSIEEKETFGMTPTQIKSVENIGEWEFLSIQDEEIVDTVRNGFFRDDKLVRIYYGTLRLGLNLHRLEHGWAQTQGDTLHVTMPPIELLDGDFIDEARTRAFYEEGSWSNSDRDKLYRKAERQMKERCLTRENMKEAEENAREQLTQLFRAMGFAHTEIAFRH